MNHLCRNSVIVLSLLLSLTFPLVAQTTSATITISNKSFPESSGWGESVRISSLSVYVNGQPIASISGSALENGSNTVLTREINLQDKLVAPSIGIFYIHHTWNIFGDHTNYYYLNLPLNQQELSQDGVAETQTFNSFYGLKMLVDWHLDFKIEISPFKPIVDNISNKQCYNSPFLLTKISNPPDFYRNSVCLDDWQYGYITQNLVENSSFFNDFLYRITNILEGNWNYYDGNFSNIENAIKYTTNYQFMEEFLYLYSDLPANSVEIANRLLSGILSQNQNLSGNEIDFLYQYFVDALTSQYDNPPPYFIYISLSDTETFASVKSESSKIEFIPKQFLTPLTDKTKVGFRTRTFNPVSNQLGPWSDIISVDLLPAPPKAGSISVTESCMNTETGKITISGITSSVPFGISEYNYNLIDSEVQYIVGPNDQSEWPKPPTPFAGSTISMNNIKAGKYKLYLSYENTSIKNCLVPDSIVVPAFPSLQSDITYADISCPGSNNGSITARITNGAGSYKISLNDNPVDASVYTFNSLKKDSYRIKTSDFCASKTEDVVINEPIPIAIGSVIKRNPTCSSPSNGGFEIPVSGGNGNKFDFSVRNSANVLVVESKNQDSPWSYYSLSGGTYTINVKDPVHNTCDGASIVVSLNDITPLSHTVTKITKVACFGDQTGAIDVKGSGGSGNYIFTLNSSPITGSSATFNSLFQGTYNIKITNNNQTCNDFDSFPVTVEQNDKILISLFPDNVSCNGLGDGHITAIVSGGSNIFQSYEWEVNRSGNWFFQSFDQSPSGLYAGEYQLKVVDSEKCIMTGNTIIGEPLPLSITKVEPLGIKCYGEAGSIKIESAGGNGEHAYFYSNNGSAYQSFASGSSFLKGSYDLKVRDIKGCETIWQNKVEISEPSPLDFTLTPQKYNGYNIKCFGDANGSIILNPQGGNEGYVFSLDEGPFQSTQRFDSLRAGTYNITLKDVKGCPLTKSVTLSQPDKLNLPVPFVYDVKCFGSATGKIVVSPIGGVSPYLLEINGTSHSSSYEFTGLLADTYDIKVTDKNNCKDSILVNVINKNQPIKTILTPQNVRCAGENNGQIAVVTTGGSGGFSHIWEKVTGGTLSSGSGIPDIQGLSPGLYRLRLKDSDQCSASDSAKIFTPLPLSVSGVIPHDIICFGGSGSIDISATGGNGGYTFSNSIDNWVSWSSFISGVPLSAAVYKLKVTDIKGCETKWYSDVKITAPDSPLSFSTALSGFNGFNISCYGLSDGSVAVTPSGGNGAGYNGYSYSFAGGSYNSQSNYVNLTSGTYPITVKDGRGCSVNQSAILTQPAQIGLMITKQVNTKCFNDSSGVITLAASGGAQPYEYRIGQKTFISANEFGKLPTGNYVFTVKDKNSCFNTVSSDIVNIYPKPYVTLVPQDISCYQKNDGVIQSSLTGGSGSFGLKWYLKSAGLWQYLKSDSIRITGLTQGDYRIQVTDLAGCPAIYDSTSIYQKVTQLVIDHVLMKDIVCFGETGSIDIQASGSNGGYIYQYSKVNLPYVNYFSGTPLSAGSYKLKVKDAKGCETIWPDNKIITSPSDVLGLTWIAKDYNGYNVSCFGNSNGRLVVKPSGGNGAGYQGYSILFSGRPVQTDTLFDNLGAGSYNIRITDGRGCTINNPVTLAQPSAPVGLSVSKLVDTKCFNDSTGIISLAASGGVLPYEFSIDQNSFAGANEFVKLPTGSYYFSVRDKNGCSNYLTSKITNIYPKPSLSLSPREISCYQKSDGLIQSSLTGGSGAFGLKWYLKTGNLWQNFKSDSTVITGLAPGDYRIQATDLAGCPAIYDSTTVFQNVTPLVIDYVLMQDIKCFGDSGSINIQASGSNRGYIYQYSKDNQSYINYSSGAPLISASYNLRVIDIKGCITSWPEKKTITQPSEPLGLSWIAKDYAGFNVSCYGNNDGLLSIKPQGGNDAGYYGYSFLLSGRPVQTDTLFENLKAGIYALDVTDGRGCTIEKQVTLTQARSELGLWTTGLKQAICFDGSDGMVSLAASGGSSPYSFSSGNEIFVSGSEFINLKVDSYRFTVKDANGCTQILDTSIFNIIPKMEITGTVSDVRCIGQNNGTISSVISGGAKPFSYQWKEIPFSNPNVESLLKGNYTLFVTDSAGCRAEKLFEVKEPFEPMVISKVTLHDIICYGDSGSIDIQAWGSNGGYIYQYSKDNLPFVNYYSGAKLPSAEYKLKVKDVKGCETLWPEKVTITQPPKALGLDWIAKDYNGSNVSCFGKHDGQLIVKPYGGNGTGYQGYSYHLQGRSLQTDTMFTNLSAGIYNLSLTDARRCTITKEISIKKPSNPVGLLVSKLVNTKCFNDSSGVITLAGSGGVQPYEYKIDTKDFVSSTEFGKLPVGSYQFLVKDKNGCSGNISSSITNIYPKPASWLIPQDIRCYQKNDGTILASFTGGSGTFDLKWYQKISNSWQLIKTDSNRITGLVPGEYLVQANDKVGCPPIYDSTTVFQKVTKLIVTATSQSACAQSQNGTIVTSADGGTSPYLFAVDRSGLQKNSSFQVYGGQHKIFVADANNCRAETEVNVDVRNTLPLINFMVATSRYELDTLVIKDVSLPKPDRVSWEFSPEALLIATNQYEAKVKYNSAGIYPVRMTGYFGTCDYTLEKLLNISPFDPLVTAKEKYLSGIESVQISPNPNNGLFKVKVKLYTKQQIQIKIFDYYSKLWYSGRYPAAMEFEQDINIPGALPGTYVLWIICDNDSRAVLFIISQ